MTVEQPQAGREEARTDYSLTLAKLEADLARCDARRAALLTAIAGLRALQKSAGNNVDRATVLRIVGDL